MWGEVEKVARSEIIIYMREVRRVILEFKELRYFVKWAGWSEDENNWEAQKGLANARELGEKFHRKNKRIQGPNLHE